MPCGFGQTVTTFPQKVFGIKILSDDVNSNIFFYFKKLKNDKNPTFNINQPNGM